MNSGANNDKMNTTLEIIVFIHFVLIVYVMVIHSIMNISDLFVLNSPWINVK